MPDDSLPKGQEAKPGAPRKKYYAHRHILHEDTVITRGKTLPADFPADSLKLLVEERSVAETPPPDPKTSGPVMKK